MFAIREAFEAHDLQIDEASVIGLLSLIFWSLILVITVKYVTFVMRADNDGRRIGTASSGRSDPCSSR
jgi:KUP system potassium uptake protein